MQPSDAFEPVREAGFHRVQRSDAFARRLIAVAGAALALAILKPWSLAQPSPASAALGRAVRDDLRESPAPADPSGSVASVASVMSVAVEDAEHVGCLRSDKWLLVTLERDGTNVVRTWNVIDAAPSLIGLPAPPVASLRIVAGNLVGIGMCAPTASDQAPPVPLVGAWAAGMPAASGSDRGPAMPLNALPRVGTPEPGMALLYGHPRDGIGEDATWPSGRYELEALDPRLNPDRVVWIAVDIVSGGNHRG